MRHLGLGLRFGLTCLILTMMGGLAASLYFLYDHYHNRDEEPALTLRDIEGAYRGVSIPSPILAALEAGHPEPLPQADRDLLLAWLRGQNIPENYENFDMGPPADLIATNCVSCHTRAAATNVASGITHSLEFPDDVLKIARSREIFPTPVNVLAISTHAHATTLALVAVLAGAMLHFSFWPRRLVGLVATLIGLGLLIDVGSWWAIRSQREFLYGIVVGGGMFNAGVWLALAMSIVELWRPRPKASQAAVVVLDPPADPARRISR